MNNNTKRKKIKGHRRHQIRQKKASKIGLSPGSLVYVGEDYDAASTIHCTRYNESEVETFRVEPEGYIHDHIRDNMVNWFNITGIHNTDVIERIGKEFGIHPLNIEDILNTEMRPKLEIYEDYIFVSLKAVYPIPAGEISPRVEQISFVLGKNYLLSFQEIESDYFKAIRQRIDREGSRLRTMKTDFLLIAQIDLIVDHYLSLIEQIGDDVQDLEDLIYDQPEKKHLHRVMANKRNLIFLWRIILPIQESLLTIRGVRSGLIYETNKIFLDDVYDHLASVKESLDMFIELNKSLRESYSFSIGFRTNEVMKLLTIISTLFIPLTFLVGVYGMNFTNMPELSWEYGYFYLWGLMVLITIVLILYFKNRKWL